MNKIDRPAAAASRPAAEARWTPFTDLGMSDRDRLLTVLAALGIAAAAGFVVIAAVASALF